MPPGWERPLLYCNDVLCPDGSLCIDDVCVSEDDIYIPPRLIPRDMPKPPDKRDENDDPPVWKNPFPDDPFDDVPPGKPNKACNERYPGVPCCLEGQGWSFEVGDETFQWWQRTGDAFDRGPVFGNNVHIDRIDPPGYSKSALADPATHVGGDYWAFSRDVNQQGSWWVGSLDVRPGPQALPGTTHPESFVGSLTSPEFVISTKLIRFFIAGSARPSQRVQLEVYRGKTNLGRFPYDGIGVSEHTDKPFSGGIASTHPDFVVVRASSPLRDGEYMERRVAWDVGAYQGYRARIVVIDTDRWAGAAEPPGHINVDEFVCTDDAADVTWRKRASGDVAQVGETITPNPLWGTTDTHAHPFANLAFGGYVQWGDPSDSLDKVYDCHTTLPEIPGPAGSLAFGQTWNIRDQITPVEPQDCGTEDWFNGLFTPALCTPILIATLGVDILTFNMCAGTVLAVLDKLDDDVPLVRLHSEHGSPTAMSGGIELVNIRNIIGALDPMLQYLLGFGWDYVAPLGDDGKPVPKPSMVELAADVPDRIPGLIPRLAWDQDDGGHSGRGIRGHQIYQKDMIRRAYQGGLRLLGLDVIDSRSITRSMRGDDTYSEWDTIHRTVHAIRRLVSCGDDPQYPTKGDLCDIAAIAYEPAQARAIVAQDKLAIVLGTETDELGIPRTPQEMTLFGHASGPDTVDRQVDDLFRLGIRKVTPIHAMNNPLGGAGIFNDTYLTGNKLLANGFDPEIQTVDHIAIPSPMPTIEDDALSFADLAGISHAEGKKDANWDTWYGDHDGWVALDLTPGLDWIGPGINFEYGFDSMATPLGHQVRDSWRTPAFESAGTWNKVNEAQIPYGINNLLVGGSMCELVDGAILPLSTEKEWVPHEVELEHQITSHGHRGQANAVGLRDPGREFMKAMMMRGMIIDLDHLSQNARVHAREVAEEIGATIGEEDRLYPFFGVHTNNRELERHGPYPGNRPELVARGGWNAETDRTSIEFQLTHHDGGVLSVGANAGYVPDVDTLFPELITPQVRNDCDFSSKSFALRYLRFVDLMAGRSLAVSTDMSPFFKPAVPRFGQMQCHLESAALFDKDGLHDDLDAIAKPCPPDHPAAINAAILGLPVPSCALDVYPHDWYPFTSSPDGMPDPVCAVLGRLTPGCPTYDNLAHQAVEGAGVVYEDYTSRARAPGPESGLGAVVEYVVARSAKENRDDGAPRARVDEVVGIGAARQLWPMKKMKTNAAKVLYNTGWDINLDGFQHIGLLPDFMQDVRNVGVTWEYMTPLFNATEEYVRMWERTTELGARIIEANVNSGPTPPLSADDLEP